MGTIGNAGSSTAKTKTVVTVTTLASLDSQSYEDQGIGVPVIGDPRKSLAEGRPHLVNSNPNINQEWGANDLNIPTNYMYADLEKSNVIAPKFLIASGYGSCAGTKVNWIHNVERCATYQEDGYPAGRWRLPTEAEMMFVSTLARELGIISDPFYVDSHYWSNSGRKYYQNAFSYNNGNYSSRCVYDLWYWGEDQLDNNGNPTTTAPATQWLFKPTK